MSVVLSKELIGMFIAIGLTAFVFGMVYQIIITPNNCNDCLHKADFVADNLFVIQSANNYANKEIIDFLKNTKYANAPVACWNGTCLVNVSVYDFDDKESIKELERGEK